MENDATLNSTGTPSIPITSEIVEINAQSLAPGEVPAESSAEPLAPLNPLKSNTKNQVIVSRLDLEVIGSNRYTLTQDTLTIRDLDLL